jgi:hypothetical protein
MVPERVHCRSGGEVATTAMTFADRVGSQRPRMRRGTIAAEKAGVPAGARKRKVRALAREGERRPPALA